MSTSSTIEIATFAGGCFWGVEHIFLRHYGPKSENKGILKTTAGYTGGKADYANPEYKVVKTGVTGHAESVRIEFDPAKVGYAELVEFFYRTHDPTTVDAQGHDIGTQYRTVIFYHSPEQLEIAKSVTEEVQKKHFDPNGQQIVTQFVEAGPWYDAEDYHQDYFTINNMDIKCPTHKLHW